MLRVGDRVYPWDNMPQTGVIVEIHTFKVSTWLVGGSSAAVAFKAVVRLDSDASQVTYKIDQLRLVE
jgi:hypothetical protein